MTHVTSVVVCVCTYRRPAQLRNCLTSLSELDLAGIHLQVLVVDNDPLGSIDDVIAPPALSWRYVQEPSKGLVAARNRSFDVACEYDADFVALIDDDEVAHGGWLRSLVEAQRTHKADVVTGPSVPQFACDAVASPSLVSFFRAQTMPSGTIVSRAATNNVLIAEWIVRSERFDSAFSATGGEDTEFFERLVSDLDVKIVWEEGATVFESVPPDRLTWRWVLSRAVRNGQIHSGLMSRAGKSATYIFAAGCARIAWGLLRATLELMRRRRLTAWSVQPLCRGLGLVSGVWGSKINAYE